MFHLVTKLVGYVSGSGKTEPDYELEKVQMRSEKKQDRMTLAKDERTHPEVLYYLAEKDPEPDVRLAVLQNKAAPVQASTLFAVDDDVDIRIALAGRLVDLLPELSEEKQGKLYAFAVQAMGTLALDEVLKVRVALSSAVKDCAYTPPKVALQLAKDIEREVSEPILRYCAALSDHDLLEVLAEYPEDWAVEAIAKRDAVGEDVSQEIVEKRVQSAGTFLIENEGSSLTRKVVERIVEAARFFPEWQKPIAVRKELPADLAKAMAEFVDGSIRNLLTSRDDFDSETIEEISEVFKRRTDLIDQTKLEGLTADDRVNLAVAENRLNEETILDALAVRDREFVIAALANKAKIEASDVERIVAMHAAKPAVAMTWRAGLSMRAALALQKELVHVRPVEIIYPKEGKDYPMSVEDLEWQVDLLGI